MDLSCLKVDFNKRTKNEEMQIGVWKKEKMTVNPLLLSVPDPQNPFKEHNDYDIHFDMDKMLENELHNVYHAFRGNSVASVRSDGGCGIFPTMFGLTQDYFPDKKPWMTSHLTKEQISNMKKSDIKPGEQFLRTLDEMKYFVKTLGDLVYVYPPDLQGPFDTAHIVYGDPIFYDLYDDEEFMDHLLDLSCHAIITGMEMVFDILPQSKRLVPHYNSLVLPADMGGLKLSEDTSTLLSQEHIERFIVPYSTKVLEHFGGGYIHYCGKNDHLLENLLGIEKNFGINFGNPDMHDMPQVLQRCAQAGKIFHGRVFDSYQPLDQLQGMFEQMLTASHADGRFNLLMTYFCAPEEAGAVMEKWERANQNVRERLW